LRSYLATISAKIKIQHNIKDPKPWPSQKPD
jgi:hypothetical protein